MRENLGTVACQREWIGAGLEGIPIPPPRTKNEGGSTVKLTRSITGVVASICTVGLMVAACGTKQESPPTTTPTTTTAPSSATPSPTEKSLDPGGGNLFTPQVKAPPAPTEPPGVHRHNS
jgi:hypothetical protein